jgi:outer membrane lipoprotein-sorting protein
MQRGIRSTRRQAVTLGAILFVLRAASVAQTTPTLDELVQKNTAALGGTDKLSALRAMKISARFFLGGSMELPLTAYLQRSGRMRMETVIQGKTMIHAFDGKETWMINPLTGSEEAKRGDAAESRKAREDAEGLMSNSLSEYVAQGSSLEFTGREELNGRPTYRLKLVDKYGTTRHIDLGAETFLEAKVTVIRGQERPDEAFEEYPTDYRPVAGVMMAHSIEMKKPGSPTMRVQFEKVEANPALEDSMFEFPAPSANRSEAKAAVAIPPGAIRIRVTSKGFEPGRVELPANQAVTLAFTREAASGCGAEVVFPASGIRKSLPVGETVLVNLPAQAAGEIGFSCGMGMLRGVMVAR